MKRRTLLVVPALVLLANSTAAQEQDATQARPRLGSPDQVDNLMDLDAVFGALTELTFLSGWHAFKADLKENHGLGFGLDYSAAWLAAGNALEGKDSNAASGMVRFFGSWELVGRGGSNRGAFVWKVEYRHAYTDTPPVALGSNLGYVGLFLPPFSGQELRFTNLYWRQSIGERFTFFTGFLDATDYVDVYGMASPWLGFTNFAFSTGVQTIPLPNDALLGVAAGGFVTDNIFIIAGLGDSNSDPTDPFQGFDSFFNQHEFFKHIEIGWTSAEDMIYLDNTHLTLWHQDERVEAGTPSGWGAVFSTTRHINEQWFPFFRAAYAEDGGSLMQKAISAGVGFQPVAGASVIGLAANWGQPNESTYGSSDLRDQYTFELFGRVQIAQELAVTPTLQWLVNPALNPGVGSTGVFGLRGRFAL
jgi:porin